MSGHLRYIPHVLALAISAVASSSYALEAISDEEMSSTTGEGLAFLPENFSIIFDPDAYINYIPVGPVSTGNKADLFIYGLAAGKSNLANNTTARTNANLNDTTVSNITSWGTGSNPWVIRTETVTKPGFNTASEARAILSFQTPDYLPTTETTAANGADAYNLKMVLWTDVMVRNAAVANGNANQFTQRLRLQGVWDGFSINGTRLNIFQTANGSGTASYNNTVGISGILRFNSGTQGVLRFSTALKANEASMITTPATGGVSPFVRGNSTAGQFNENEGLYIRDFDLNLPLGQLHYQPLVLDATASGNVIIELARIPNNASAYNEFYVNYTGISDAELSSGVVANATVSGRTAAQRAAELAKLCTGTYCGSASISGTGTVINATPTHGSLSMGNVTFRSPTNTAVDLGSASIQGLMIQHLKLTTTGL